MTLSIASILGYGIPSLIIFLFYKSVVFNDSRGNSDDEFFLSLFMTIVTMGILIGLWSGEIKLIW